jgi:hypothetical protein
MEQPSNSRPLFGPSERQECQDGTGVIGTCIQIGALLERCPADMQVLAPWTWEVVPSGFSFRGPDVSLDMCLLTISDDAAGSEMSEQMAVSLIDPLG